MSIGSCQIQKIWRPMCQDIRLRVCQVNVKTVKNGLSFHFLSKKMSHKKFLANQKLASGRFESCRNVSAEIRKIWQMAEEIKLQRNFFNWKCVKCSLLNVAFYRPNSWLLLWTREMVSTQHNYTSINFRISARNNIKSTVSVLEKNMDTTSL